eukprot:snap_masked-scaffold_25-processed-gene-5.7-mRNA-1 protein AED:1.00 eAED:1.00 QI:0/0/0/0/1/1/2/0/116
MFKQMVKRKRRHQFNKNVRKATNFIQLGFVLKPVAGFVVLTEQCSMYKETILTNRLLMFNYAERKLYNTKKRNDTQVECNRKVNLHEEKEKKNFLRGRNTESYGKRLIGVIDKMKQ